MLGFRIFKKNGYVILTTPISGSFVILILDMINYVYKTWRLCSYSRSRDVTGAPKVNKWLK